MPNTRRSKSNRRSSGRSKRNPDPVEVGISSRVQDLLAVQHQQLRYAMPNTRDVPMPNMKQKAYTFMISSSNVITITSSTATATSFAYAFTLTNVPGYAQFTGLFDRYRILNAQVQFNPTQSSPLSVPLTTAIDYDDASSPTASLADRDTAMTVPTNQYFERSLVPTIALAAYGGTTFTSYANASNRIWIDSASSGVQYYGLKGYLPAASSAVLVYNVTFRFVVQFKNNF